MSLKKGFVYVFISNLIGVILSILTGFILPKFLSIASYSDIKLFQLYISYVGILHLGYSDGMYLKYGGKNINEINKEDVLAELRTFRLFQFIVLLIGLLLTLITRNEILFFCILSLLPINVGNYLKNLYQATGNFDKYAKFININNLLIFIMNLILLFIIKSDNAVYYIISYILSYFIYWYLLEREVSLFFGKKSSKLSIIYLVDNVREGFLLMLGNFTSVFFTSIDRLLVKNFLGIIKFAYYSFAVGIENLMNTIINPISVIMYNYLCKNQQKEKIIFMKVMLLILISFTIGLVFPVSFIVKNWIGKYMPSLIVLYILFASQYFMIIVKCVFNNLYKAQRKQNRYFIVMITVIIISIILNLLGYMIFENMEIFAIATFITSIIWFIIGEFDFRKYHYSLKQYFYMILVVSIFLITTIYFNSILGAIIYVSTVIILTIVLLSEETVYIKNEIIKCFQKIKKNN